MKKTIVAMTMLLYGSMAFAQTDDPVIMTIAGHPVQRSEFEYSYNKNNSEGVIDKKTVEEYVDLFVNYKLKVQAALDAKLDTMISYQKEFRTYRDQQITPSFVTDEAIEKEARQVYQNTKESIGPRGLIMPAHILILLNQKATDEEQKAAKVRIDSVYQALKQGADFEALAKKVSQDPGSASKGGVLPWIGLQVFVIPVDQKVDRLLLRDAAKRKNHIVIRLDAELLFYGIHGRRVFVFDRIPLRVDACRDDGDRAIASDRAKVILDLIARRDEGIEIAGLAAEEEPNRVPSDAIKMPAGEVIGIILDHRVEGIDLADSKSRGEDRPEHPNADIGLAMDDIRIEFAHDLRRFAVEKHRRPIAVKELQFNAGDTKNAVFESNLFAERIGRDNEDFVAMFDKRLAKVVGRGGDAIDFRGICIGEQC